MNIFANDWEKRSVKLSIDLSDKSKVSWAPSTQTVSLEKRLNYLKDGQDVKSISWLVNIIVSWVISNALSSEY